MSAPACPWCGGEVRAPTGYLAHDGRASEALPRCVACGWERGVHAARTTRRLGLRWLTTMDVERDR
jgi:hypothetical protein